MTESKGEVVGIDISPVVTEYNKWEEHGKKLAIDQALHPEILNNIPWEEGITPREIAEFTLQTARKEALWWVDDRKDNYLFEKGKDFDKVRQVGKEIRKILRREKV